MSATTLPDLSGFTEHRGIRVCPLGDDGDVVVALGHHNVDDTLAAIVRMLRRDLGWTARELAGLGAPAEVKDALRLRWAVLATDCGDGFDPDCGTCAEVRAADWWLDYSSTTRVRDSFPVTVLHLD